MAVWTWDTGHFTFDDGTNHTFDGFHTHGIGAQSTHIHAVTVTSHAHVVGGGGHTHVVPGGSHDHTVSASSHTHTVTARTRTHST